MGVDSKHVRRQLADGGDFRTECRGAEVGSEPCDAGDQGQDVASFVAGLSCFAEGVLGSAPLGRGYFVASSGNVTDEMIAEYIESQGAEPQEDEEFKISG